MYNFPRVVHVLILRSSPWVDFSPFSCQEISNNGWFPSSSSFFAFSRLSISAFLPTNVIVADNFVFSLSIVALSLANCNGSSVVPMQWFNECNITNYKHVIWWLTFTDNPQHGIHLKYVFKSHISSLSPHTTVLPFHVFSFNILLFSSFVLSFFFSF